METTSALSSCRYRRLKKSLPHGTCSDRSESTDACNRPINPFNASNHAFRRTPHEPNMFFSLLEKGEPTRMRPEWLIFEGERRYLLCVNTHRTCMTPQWTNKQLCILAYPSRAKRFLLFISKERTNMDSPRLALIRRGVGAVSYTHLTLPTRR